MIFTVAGQPIPRTLTPITDYEQEGPAGTQLADPFVVEIRDQNGSPVAGVTVTFGITAGDGTLSVETATTDADGRASTTLILGRTPGTNIIRAIVEGLEPVTFTATGLAVARALAKLSGDQQQAVAGTTLSDPFVVEVLDQNGAALPGAVVTFVVLGDGGTLSASADTTDAEGLAGTTLTLGPTPGTNEVTATVADLEPVTFTATAEATPDFNGDGVTDLSDFYLFAEAFGGTDPRFDLDGSGTVDFADFFLFAESFGQPARARLVAMAKELIGLPDGPQLRQNAPNPFNSGTVITWFQLQPGVARLEVFALTGQRVAVLHEGLKEAGFHRSPWGGRDDQGRPLASGVYVYRLVTAEAMQTRKLTLLRCEGVGLAGVVARERPGRGPRCPCTRTPENSRGAGDLQPPRAALPRWSTAGVRPVFKRPGEGPPMKSGAPYWDCPAPCSRCWPSPTLLPRQPTACISAPSTTTRGGSRITPGLRPDRWRI